MQFNPITLPLREGEGIVARLLLHVYEVISASFIWLTAIDFAFADMVGFAYDAFFFHAFDDGCGAIVTNG